jgi:hypothetical protein
MAPTKVVVDDLVANGFERVKLWSRGVDMDIFHPQTSKRLESEPPIFCTWTRRGGEKRRSIPGARSARFEVGRRYRSGARSHPRTLSRTNFLGVLERDDLAKVYAAADVRVSSRTDTFGLVFARGHGVWTARGRVPVTGPRDVIGDSNAGVLHEDLRTACLEALKLQRQDAVGRARLFSWRAATEQFFGHLHPRSRVAELPVIA